MPNWTIRQRIFASLSLTFVLLALMVGAATLYFSRISAEVRQLQADELPGLHDAALLASDWHAAHALTEEYALQPQGPERGRLLEELRRLRGSQDARLTQYEATVTTTVDRDHVSALKAAIAVYRQTQDRVLGPVDTPHDQPALAAVRAELSATFDHVLDALRSLLDYNKAAADEATADIGVSVGKAREGMLSLGLLALIAATISGILLLRAVTDPLRRLKEGASVLSRGDFSRRVELLRRDEFAELADGFNRMRDDLAALVGQVQQSGLRVATSVTEIAATAREQQATATEIAATTTEIGATSKEIAATSKDLVRTMGEVAEGAEQSALLAGNGQAGLAQMEETMQRVMAATVSINAKLAVLNEKASNIGQMVTTITKVADQTNLLSLNAAIEAEKAGEYGRGFAVVATEIRRLADQTAVATSDIEQMVKEIQSSVSASVMGVDKFSEEVRHGMREVQQVGTQLGQIIERVQALAPRMEAVNEGMQAQATGAEQITQALLQLGDASQQTVESLRQSAQAIAELDQVSGGLRDGVARFKLEA